MIMIENWKIHAAGILSKEAYLESCGTSEMEHFAKKILL